MKKRQYEDVLVKGSPVPYYSQEHIDHLEDLITSLQTVRERYPRGSSRRSDYTRSLGHIRKTLGHIRTGMAPDLRESLLRGEDRLHSTFEGVTLAEYEDTFREFVKFGIYQESTDAKKHTSWKPLKVILAEGTWRLHERDATYLRGVYGVWGERLGRHIEGLASSAWTSMKPGDRRSGINESLDVMICLYESCDAFCWTPFKTYCADLEPNPVGTNYNVLSEGRYTRLKMTVLTEFKTALQEWIGIDAMRSSAMIDLLSEYRGSLNESVTDDFADQHRTIVEDRLHNICGFLTKVLECGYVGNSHRLLDLEESVRDLRLALQTPFENLYESVALVESALAQWNGVQIFTDDGIYEISTYDAQ